jgi:hypothetical protein
MYTATLQPGCLFGLHNEELQRNSPSSEAKLRTFRLWDWIFCPGRTYLIVVCVPEGKRRLAVVLSSHANAPQRTLALAKESYVSGILGHGLATPLGMVSAPDPHVAHNSSSCSRYVHTDVDLLHARCELKTLESNAVPTCQTLGAASPCLVEPIGSTHERKVMHHKRVMVVMHGKLTLLLMLR